MQEREIHKIYNTRAAEKQDDFDYFFFFIFFKLLGTPAPHKICQYLKREKFEQLFLETIKLWMIYDAVSKQDLIKIFTGD